MLSCVALFVSVFAGTHDWLLQRDTDCGGQKVRLVSTFVTAGRHIFFGLPAKTDRPH